MNKKNKNKKENTNIEITIATASRQNLLTDGSQMNQTEENRNSHQQFLDMDCINEKQSPVYNNRQQNNRRQSSQNNSQQNSPNSIQYSVLQTPPFNPPNKIIQNYKFWLDDLENDNIYGENRFREDDECLDFSMFDPNYNQKLKKDNFLYNKLQEVEKKVQQNKKGNLDWDEVAEKKFLDLFNEFDEDQENFDVHSGVENGRITKFYWDRCHYIELSHLLLTSVTMVITLSYYSCDSLNLLEMSKINMILELLWLIQLIDFLFCRYKAVLDLEIHQQNIQPPVNIVTAGYLKYMLIEMLVLGIQPIPFLDEYVSYYENEVYEYKMNWTLSLLSMSRVYVVIRHILKMHQFMTARGNRICKMYGCKASYQFTLKCYFKDIPLKIVTIFFLISVFYFAFLIRICEGVLFQEIEDNSMDFSQIINCIWASVITMTTVGYGDYFAKTIQGRVLTFFIATWGNIILSLLTVVLTNLLEGTNGENKSIHLIHKLQVRKQLKEKTANLVTSLAKYHRLIEQRREVAGVNLDQKYLEKRDLKIQKCTEQFQQFNRKMKSMNDQQNVGEEMCRQFDYLDRELSNLKMSQKHLCLVLEEIYEEHLYNENLHLKQLQKKEEDFRQKMNQEEMSNMDGISKATSLNQLVQQNKFQQYEPSLDSKSIQTDSDDSQDYISRYSLAQLQDDLKKREQIQKDQDQYDELNMLYKLREGVSKDLSQNNFDKYKNMYQKGESQKQLEKTRENTGHGERNKQKQSHQMQKNQQNSQSQSSSNKFSKSLQSQESLISDEDQ